MGMRRLPVVYQQVATIDRRRCHTTWNSVQALECMEVTSRGIQHRMDAYGCLEIWLPDFLRVQIGTPVQSSAARVISVGFARPYRFRCARSNSADKSKRCSI